MEFNIRIDIFGEIDESNKKFSEMLEGLSELI